jgi:hypothetical protein
MCRCCGQSESREIVWIVDFRLLSGFLRDLSFATWMLGWYEVNLKIKHPKLLQFRQFTTFTQQDGFIDFVSDTGLNVSGLAPSVHLRIVSNLPADSQSPA